MKVPIIADDFGDLLIFDSLKKAESYLEAIDVKQRDYPVYDSEGRRLSARVVKDGKKPERVAIVEPDKEPRHESELRALLIAFLDKVLQPRENLESLPLQELILRALRFKTE
jgi:hypothetical protein